MSNRPAEERDHAYFIQLPIDEALEVSDELETTVWEIAREEGVEEALKDAQFDIRIGKTAIDPNAVVTVIVHLAATGAVSGAASKITSIAIDQAWKAWLTKILPALKKKLV